MCSVLCFPSVHTVPKKVAFIQRIKTQKESAWANFKYNWPFCTNVESNHIRKLLLSQIIPKNEELPNLSDNNYFVFFSSEKVALSKKKTRKESGRTNIIGLYVPTGNPTIFEDFYWLKSFPKTNSWT